MDNHQQMELILSTLLSCDRIKGNGATEQIKRVLKEYHEGTGKTTTVNFKGELT
jgi:hypothetical protein